jgi:hypothetical protein
MRDEVAGLAAAPISVRTSEDHEHTLGDIRPLSRGNVD